MEHWNEILTVEMGQFLPGVIKKKAEGWRLVQICASRLPGQFELSYSFAKEMNMETLRLVVGEEETVPSITQIYSCAFIQENEMAELFGVRVQNIEVDYHNKLYRISRETPFKEKG